MCLGKFFPLLEDLGQPLKPILILLLTDRNLNSRFYDAGRGRDPIFYVLFQFQVLFFFYYYRYLKRCGHLAAPILLKPLFLRCTALLIFHTPLPPSCQSVPTSADLISPSLCPVDLCPPLLVLHLPFPPFNPAHLCWFYDPPFIRATSAVLISPFPHVNPCPPQLI